MPLPRISAAPAAPGPWTGFTQPPVPPQSQQRAARRRRSPRGLGIGLAALVVAAGVGFAPLIPSANGAGAAWTSFLPWTVLVLVLLGAAAVIRQAWWGLSAVIVAAMVWSAVFVPQMLPATAQGGTAQLTVATQNIGAANTDPLSSAQALVASGAGIVAVQEIVGTDGAATGFLDAQYGYNERVSTVGLWSQWPMSEPETFELGMSWARSFRVVVHHSQGDIAVYAVHLPSVRPGDTDDRDQAVAELAALVAADPAEKVLVMGDLNTATTDPTLAVLTDELTASLTDSREAVKGGFGFTWPAQFPMTRPDHVLGRGVTPVFDEVLAAGGSDHRAVLVGLNLQ